MKDYGKELILDIHCCNASHFTRSKIEQFFIELCELIDMDRQDLHWWDYTGYPEEYADAPAHLKGISAIQFIKTSNITVHALDDLKRIYINIFSCKDFEVTKAAHFAVNYFDGLIANSQVVRRM